MEVSVQSASPISPSRSSIAEDLSSLVSKLLSTSQRGFALAVSDSGEPLGCRSLDDGKPTTRDEFTIGIKRGTGVTIDALIELGYRDLLARKYDLLAVIPDGGAFAQIVTAERGVSAHTVASLPLALVTRALERFSTHYFRTNLEKVETLPVPEKEVAEFLGTTRDLGSLALFDPYYSGAREEFGFLAKRTERGTLITGRGSSKSDAGASDLGLVTAVDLEQRTLSVTTLGAKGSLNASLAHLIFQARPEVQYVLHAHIPVAEAVSTGRDTAPATIEDWRLVEPLVRTGARVIDQPHHGVLILLERLSELFPLLERNNLYERRPLR